MQWQPKYRTILVLILGVSLDEGRYSVSAVLKTVLLQTHSNMSDVQKQKSLLLQTTQSYDNKAVL